MTKNNRILLRFAVVGLLLPILASPIVTWILYNRKPRTVDDRGFITGTYSYWELFGELVFNPAKLPLFMSLCALINLPVFFYFIKKNMEFRARGVLFGTLVYAVIFMYFKLV